ncbi:MAG: hypothetical protein MI861_14645 [Pirellulales bacterium]|nr:hypothetical protein [Pirellulales bacterium]
MDIVILHCHFERGGVTQVVQNHVRSLADSEQVDRILLVSGRANHDLSAQTTRRVQHVLLPEFDYDVLHPAAGQDWSNRAERIAGRLSEELSAAGFQPDSTIVHWHNHSLGKNTAAPAAIGQLARSGWRFLLQVHDFAEDNRPENYLRLVTALRPAGRAALDRFLYPHAPHIHYATLTGGDAQVLVALGIAKSRVHCLPNSVSLATADLPGRAEALSKVRRSMRLPDHARWCLYPVRGIRRKNVGEFLLLSRWLPENWYAGLTLCPATEIEKQSYLRWRRLANQVAPAAIFDAAHHPEVSFGDNLAASEFVMSTSVAEGFGMAFLEPWLAKRGVIARKLPGVTDDFESAGVEFPLLYDGIAIPGDRKWILACRHQTELAFKQAWRQVPETFRPASELDWPPDPVSIDFAQLTPARQTEVLQRLARDPGYERLVMESAGGLAEAITRPVEDRLVQRNAERVRQRYSLDSQRGRLLPIYRELLAAETVDEFDQADYRGDAINLVARTRPFYPCRTETVIDG